MLQANILGKSKVDRVTIVLCEIGSRSGRILVRRPQPCAIHSSKSQYVSRPTTEEQAPVTQRVGNRE